MLTNVAGGFAATIVRNETQRHSAALKSAGQNPVGLLPLYLLRRLSPALQSPLDTIPRSSVLEPLYRWPSVAIHRPPSALTRLSARKPARLSGFNAPVVQGRRAMMALLGPSCPDAAPTVRLAAAHIFWGKDPTNGLTKRLATSSNLLRRDLNQLFYIPVISHTP